MTARLSKRSHNRLGEAVTNELVDWLNQVDATYRSDLRDLNEVNYARFEAKLEQRIAELRGALLAELAKQRAETQAALASQTRFFFLAWAALLGAIIGLWFR